MNNRATSLWQAAARSAISALLVGALVLASACTSTGEQGITGFDELTLSPGDTGQCESSPCRVLLKMPSGSGSYEVTANEATVGQFPAGETVDLGSFWQSQAIEIKGLDVPKAYAYIPDQP